MEANPYAVPVANLDRTDESFSHQELGEGVFRALEGTKPWVRVVGVLLWLGVGIMILAALGMVMLGSIGSALPNQSPAGISSAMSVGLAVLYLVLAAVYVYPALTLWRYGSRIEDLLQSRRTSDLAAALEAQRAFWKFLGVSFLLFIGLYVLVVIGAIGFGLFSSASSQ